ncbi:squalene synthase HpnD [Acetobacteraceae bacterium]|nr:squalene synthase HpnD [Acetobacteraceae bacterium]
MRILPRARREAMYALYAFCRELDDIADGDSSAGRDIKKSLTLLNHWSSRIDHLYDGNAQDALERVLLAAIRTYGLNKVDFQEIIEGMRMDLEGPIVFPDEQILDLYCDRVASAVGRISVRIFGARSKNADQVAYYLGRALQQVNILRDLNSDISLGRCYLPKQLVGRFQISTNIHSLLESDDIGSICKILAERAKDNFKSAEYYMGLCPTEAMKPARLMAASYKATLKSLEKQGWKNFKTPLKKSLAWKIIFFTKALIGK